MIGDADAVPRWPALDPFADAVNPALGLALLVFWLAALGRRRWREALGLPFTLLATLAVAYGLAFVDRAIGAFAFLGLDFSTHGAVHLAAWATLLAWRPRVWPAALGVTLAYFALMLWQGYHTVADLLLKALVTGKLLSVLLAVIRASGGGTPIQPPRGTMSP